MADAAPLPGRRVTRRDVARHAGVSDAVVSYTLSGRAPVAAATAQRVRDAIDALGYQPNLAARALKSGSASAFALIAPSADDPVLANPFFIEFAGAVEAAARARGYAVFMTSGAPGAEGLLERARDFASRQVDGLVVVPDDSSNSAGLDTLGLPWVQLNTQTRVPGIFSVGADLYDGAYRATEHLIDHGHATVGFVGEADDSRARGWRDACRDRGVERGAHIESGYGREDGYRAGRRLLEHPDPPAAVFTASDLIALGVMRAAHERGVSMPDDLALTSFDGSWEADYTWPRLTTVRQPIEEMAEAAIAMLLRESGDTPVHREFRGTLIERESCGDHAA